jgi:hypothetical protein
VGKELMVWGAAVHEDCVVVEREGYVGKGAVGVAEGHEEKHFQSAVKRKGRIL